jgi:hypothetical protein
MKLASVQLARTLAFVETFDLTPRGSLFYPEVATELVERYHFQKFPQTIEEFDEVKGVTFLEGRIGKTVIEKITIFNTLLVLETRVSTDESQRVILQILEWAKERFGLTFEPSMIRHWGFVSSITFFSDAPILAFQPLLDLATKTGTALSEIWKEPVTYHPLLIGVGHDPLTRKNGIAALTIARRAEVPVSENKYFSEAPLPTDMHIRFLQEYEQAVTSLAFRT